MSNKPNFMRPDKVLPFPRNKQPAAPAQVNLSNEPGLYCPRCLREGFTDVFGYKHISRLISPNGQEQIFKARVGVLCVHCGWAGEMDQLKLLRPDEHMKAVEELAKAPLQAQTQTDSGLNEELQK